MDKNNFDLIKEIPNLDQYFESKNSKKINWFNSLLMVLLFLFSILLGILITFLLS